MKIKVTKYDAQANKFLASNSIKFRATLSDSKPAPWAGEREASTEPHHFRVTLSKACRARHSINCICKDCRLGNKPLTRIVFDFWSSITDAEKGIETIESYSVMACISSDVNCPSTFADFCAEYGYEDDSIKALQTFRRCSAFAKRLRAFFTADELEQLAEIQ